MLNIGRNLTLSGTINTPEEVIGKIDRVTLADINETASLIYDMLTDSSTYKFETSNKPIIKTSA